MTAAANASTQPPIIALVGPTASGKSSAAIQLAQTLGGQVISADSQLVYRGLDIGTATPTPAERQGIPHHMIDVAEPSEAYSVAQYQQQAGAVLQTLLAQNTPVVVAGGTGFYLRALLQEHFLPTVPPNPAFREAMQAMVDTHGREALHTQLRQKDPRRAAQLHPNDSVRIIRALEIIDATGEPVPDNRDGLGLNIRWIGLGVESRDWLRQRIDHRIELMLAEGWENEVKHLVSLYGPQAHALQVAHGYPQLVQVLQGERTLEDALEEMRINIHQYATRQFTWFHRNPEIQWLKVDTLSDTQRTEQILKFTNL